MIVAVVAALAGGAGAVARYATDRAVENAVGGTFPLGTAVVNVVGALILGAVTGLVRYHGVPARYDDVLGVGFCGGLTTWSTATWESVRLVEGRLYAQAVVYALGGLVVAVAAGAAGMAIAAL